MSKPQRIDVIVRFYIDEESDKVMGLAPIVIAAILKDRDWNGIQEKSITIGPNKDLDETRNLVEFKMLITSDMKYQDLNKLARDFIMWLKDSDL